MYRFRLRWQLEPGRRISELEGPVAMQLMPGGDCELKAVAKASSRGGQHMVLRSGAFPSEQEALAAGQALCSGLLLHSLRGGYGVAIAERTPKAVLTDVGKRLLGGVRDDALGVEVFEDSGDVRFFRADMELSTGEPAHLFAERLGAAAAAVRQCDERVLVSYTLYADARFDRSSVSRFLMLVMAIEALAERPERSPRELEVLETLIGSVEGAGLDQRQAAALIDALHSLKQVSISFACRSYLAEAIEAGVVTDRDAGTHFTECYKIRGQIVHGGTTPDVGDLLTRSNRLEPTVRELLIARMEGRARPGG